MMVLTFILLVSVCTASPLERIVGGTESQENAWPWQLSLQYRSDTAGKYHICGAVLLSEYYAVTAAHCVYHDPYANKYQIVAGEHDFDKTSNNEQYIDVADFTMHAGYVNSGGYPNDIAILKLAKKVEMYSKITEAVNLPNNNADFTGKRCVISGWGRLSGGGQSPSVLNEAETKVISHSECRSRFSFFIRSLLEEDKHICIYTGANGACNGDSGGPLMCDVNGQWQLAGVTSWGASGCPTGSPSVYTRISNYREFIDSHIKQS